MSENTVTKAELEQVERALVDSSVKAPVLFFFTMGMLWLLASTILGFISSVKLHSPDFLTTSPFLTYGRVWPVYLDSLLYGWGVQAGIGVAIWILARLCKVAMKRSALAIAGGALWNLGTALGCLGVLGGNSTGIDLLEMPRFALTLMLVGYLLVGAWVWALVQQRREGPSFISLWYLLGAFVCFPWAFGAASFMIFGGHTTGVMQNIVDAWYIRALFGFWFMSLGLGTAYYLIPKVLGRPVASYELASAGFWSLMALVGWTGMTRLDGGPVPVWLVTVSIATTILLVIPMALIALNFKRTMDGNFQMVFHSPTVRFTFFGVVSWVIAILLLVATSFRSVSHLLQATQLSVAVLQIVAYAFFTMIMFGAMYYIVPRLVGCEWISPAFIHMHFLGSAYGIAFTVAMLLIGSLSQGSAWANLDVTNVQVFDIALPFLRGRSIGWLLLFVGHVTFGLHFFAMLLRLGRPAGAPTLFAPLPSAGSSQPSQRSIAH
jgi:cytochrome c oxidase cbb3-type subunit 1